MNLSRDKAWFALSGPAGTGKTTLMYEVVACLRELGLEAVGVTERVRLMPGMTHQSLCQDPDLHYKLFDAQLAIENELNNNNESQIVILDRCLLDYVLLARQTFPDYEFDINLNNYLNDFNAVVMPMSLFDVGSSVKVRPDESFRQESVENFNAFQHPRIVRFGSEVLLRDRCKFVTNLILDKIGKSEIFRDYYLLTEIGTALKDYLTIAGVNDARIWVSGSRCSLSPNLPSYDSDVDMFVSTNSDKLGLSGLDYISKILKHVFGINVEITTISNRTASVVRLKELIIT